MNSSFVKKIMSISKFNFIYTLIFFSILTISSANSQDYKYRYKVEGVILHKNVQIPNKEQSPEEELDPCLTGEIGTVCETDGAIYVGEIGGVRRYAADSSIEGKYWGAWDVIYNNDYGGSMTNVNSAFSENDGEINTNILTPTYDYLVDPSRRTGTIAMDCRNKGNEWYLPTRIEVELITLSLLNEFYPSGDDEPIVTSSTPGNGVSITGVGYNKIGGYKTTAIFSFTSNIPRVICFRKDLS